MFSFTTILAIIGLVIGISSLIVVTSIMNGFEKELENRILGVIPHSVIYSDEPIKNYENLIKDIKNYPDIIDASPYINIQGLISSEYESKGINIIGIDVAKEENMSIIPQYMVAGELESLNQSNSIVLGSLLAANISAYIGDEINIIYSIFFVFFSWRIESIHPHF